MSKYRPKPRQITRDDLDMLVKFINGCVPLMEINNGPLPVSAPFQATMTLAAIERIKAADVSGWMIDDTLIEAAKAEIKGQEVATSRLFTKVIMFIGQMERDLGVAPAVGVEPKVSAPVPSQAPKRKPPNLNPAARRPKISDAAAARRRQQELARNNCRR